MWSSCATRAHRLIDAISCLFSGLCLPRIPSLSTTGTLIADLVDALSLLASTSEFKGWQSLPRPGVECMQVLRVLVAKEPGFDQQKFGRVDQGEA